MQRAEILAGVPAELKEAVEELLRESLRITPSGKVPHEPTSSYVGGHPYLPEGESWPEEDGHPMTFLAQVNFAETPHLPGYPRAGLLQWYCGNDDTFGLTFDGPRQGIDGMHVRWYDTEALHVPSSATPTGAIPTVDQENTFSPLIEPGPHGIQFEKVLTVPGYDQHTRNLPDTYFELLEDEVLPGPSESSIGGHPDLVQGDPREEHPERDSTLILQLGSLDGALEWGDSGTAQLFGNPEELARGELRSLWWDWACA